MGCTPNDDVALNESVAVFQRGLDDWKLGELDLASLGSRVSGWIDSQWLELVAAETRLASHPPVHVVFHWDRRSRLGHYRPGRNAAGIRWELSINPANVARKSEMQTGSTVLHELLHLAEDQGASGRQPPRSRNGYHSSWFQKLAKKLGIPCNKYGAGEDMLEGSPYVLWAIRHGLSGEPTPVEEDDELVGKPPRAKRVSWICGCPVTVMVAAGGEFEATCDVCEEKFQKGRAA